MHVEMLKLVVGRCRERRDDYTLKPYSVEQLEDAIVQLAETQPVSSVERSPVESVSHSLNSSLPSSVQPDETAKLREEVERLTKCLSKANSKFEEYERKYYLTSDELAAALAAVRDWKGRFEEYGWHGAVCPAQKELRAVDGHCDCGFRELLTQAQKEQPDASALEEKKD